MIFIATTVINHNNIKAQIVLITLKPKNITKSNKKFNKQPVKFLKTKKANKALPFQANNSKKT